MDPSQELLATMTSFEKVVTYIQTHEWHTVFIAVGLLLAPFIVKFLLKLLWSLFSLLTTFLFKDQIKDYLRRKISALLQYYVDESITVEDTPIYQTNLITLFCLRWNKPGFEVNVNRAEVRVDLGYTVRQYLKLWLRHLVKDFDYRSEQKKLLSNCIKDVRLYRADVRITMPEPADVSSQTKMLEAAKTTVKSNLLGLDSLRKLDLNVAFESGEVLVFAGGEEFRFQNFFGLFENLPNETGSRCNVRLGCIYDGENISFNSIDDNLEKFMLVVSNVYFSHKIWNTACAYCNYLPKDLDIRDGKILDVRATLGLHDEHLRVLNLAAKMDEVQFIWRGWKVDDMEISLYSQDWQTIEVKKAVARVNDSDVSVKTLLHLDNGVLSTERVDLRVGDRTATFVDVWFDTKTGEQHFNRVEEKVVDSKGLFDTVTQKVSNIISKKISGFTEGLKGKIKSLTK